MGEPPETGESLSRKTAEAGIPAEKELHKHQRIER
jgi:hypothetical protein